MHYFQKDALLEDTNDSSRYYPNFEKLMDELEVRRGEGTSTSRRVDSGNYLFVPGHIVVVNPGVNNEVPSADKWWLLQVNKAHHSNKTANACFVYGFWLDEQLQSNDDCRVFSLMSNPVKIYFGSIIKNCGTPLFISATEITTGWRNGHVSCAFSNKYFATLDQLSNEHRLSLERNIHEQEEYVSANEDEGEVGEDNNDSEYHEVELSLLSRKRIIRSSDGNRVTSYRDLAGIGRRERRRQQWRTLEGGEGARGWGCAPPPIILAETFI